ncbi:MAG: rhodanese-related (seleno)protein [Pseudomonadota bacterium]
MKKKLLAILMLILLTIALFTSFALSADVPMMTKEELKAMLDSPDLAIFDVRMGSDYFSSDLKIKGAVRPVMGAPLHETLFSTYPKGKTFVVYCASSNEERSTANVKDILSYGRDGYTKIYVLKGGWEEWLKANYPTEKK